MNEHKELGLPYDFRIERTDRSADNIEFIEVKSTTKATQQSFPVSYQELLFAHKFAEQFQIYRLYNAGSDPQKVELKVITDLATRLHMNHSKLFVII